MLQAGDKAFEFSLLNQDGKMVNLTDFLGSKVVLYFYPKDDTPGCTTQACVFRDNYHLYKDHGVNVLGVSVDDSNKHTKFIEKYNLPFTLLADTEKEVVEEYGVWAEKVNYGKKYMGIKRTTFIINEKGYIEKVYENAKPDTNATEILKYLGIL